MCTRVQNQPSLPLCLLAGRELGEQRADGEGPSLRRRVCADECSFPHRCTSEGLSQQRPKFGVQRRERESQSPLADREACKSVVTCIGDSRWAYTRLLVLTCIDDN